MRRRRFLVLVLILVGAAAAPAAAQEDVVLLVRHAETAPDGTRDPALSPAGVSRAADLAALLRDAGLSAVYTTDYARTRTTAATVADAVGVETLPYDPRELEAFARDLRGAEGTVLVVGHSNTTPELVRLLGGDPGPPIPEDEHDRLYVLFRGDSGVRTVVLRYGGR